MSSVSNRINIVGVNVWCQSLSDRKSNSQHHQHLAIKNGQRLGQSITEKRLSFIHILQNYAQHCKFLTNKDFGQNGFLNLYGTDNTE